MARTFKERFRRNRETLEWYDALAVAVAVIALIFTFAVRIVQVDGSSMNPTLYDGDRVLIAAFLQPQYEDVVVVDSYIPYGKPLVKRVIGKEGDVIDIDFEQGIVYRNGEALEEPYIAEPTWMQESVNFPITVPKGCLYLMGDNRNQSADSRYPEIGIVDERCVIGRVVAVIFPFSNFGLL